MDSSRPEGPPPPAIRVTVVEGVIRLKVPFDPDLVDPLQDSPQQAPGPEGSVWEFGRERPGPAGSLVMASVFRDS